MVAGTVTVLLAPPLLGVIVDLVIGGAPAEAITAPVLGLVCRTVAPVASAVTSSRMPDAVLVTDHAAQPQQCRSAATRSSSRCATAGSGLKSRRKPVAVATLSRRA